MFAKTECLVMHHFSGIIKQAFSMQVAYAEGSSPAPAGGFGKGNFGELFKSIEDYERTLSV